METSPEPAAPDTWKQPQTHTWKQPQTPGSSRAPGQEPGESEAQGMPPLPPRLQGTAAALDRCSSCSAGGGGNLGVHFKGTRALLGLKRSLPGASACKGDFCYQTLPRGRENSCVSV